jgi:hypothetical protein
MALLSIDEALREFGLQCAPTAWRRPRRPEAPKTGLGMIGTI